MMNNKSESGSAILWILIATALFAAVGFTMMRGSGSSTTMLTDEQSRADAFKSTDYANAVNQAVKRLKLRGCADGQISYETPNGNDENPDAPADERCHVFRAAGGGISFRGEDIAASAPDECETGDIGDVCADGAFYIGATGGNRIYARASDSGSGYFSSPFSASPTSDDDGLANTLTQVNTPPGGHDYQAAGICDALEPGVWYLPALNEIKLLWTNRAALDLSSRGIDTSGAQYWTSSQYYSGGTVGWVKEFSGGAETFVNKATSLKIRCVRR